MMADVRLIDANSLKEIQIYALVDDKSIENGISFAPITCVLKEEIDNAPTADMDERDADAFESGYIAGLNADKPKGEWIPVSERLPDDLEPVNITWINHEPEPYYKEIKDKPFTATGVYFNGQWYWWSTLCTDTLAEYSHNYDDIIDTAIEVIAWQELPEPYKKGGKEE